VILGTLRSGRDEWRRGRPAHYRISLELLSELRIKLLHAKDEKRRQELSRKAVYESDAKKLSQILRQTGALLKSTNVRPNKPQR
jgi:hypothetical protein